MVTHHPLVLRSAVDSKDQVTLPPVEETLTAETHGEHRAMVEHNLWTSTSFKEESYIHTLSDSLPSFIFLQVIRMTSWR